MKKIYLVIIFGIIVTAGIFAYFLKPGPGQKPHESTAPVKTESAAEQQHNTGSDAPAVKAEESQQQDEEEEVPTIEIPVEKQRMIGVKTFEVAIKPLQHVIRTVGRIEYDEKRLATVNTKIEGWIERLYVDYTGKYVRKGEPLADIYS
jgi:Cu(I)/Ag(I) efflux system membrane fusion protein